MRENLPEEVSAPTPDKEKKRRGQSSSFPPKSKKTRVEDPKDCSTILIIERSGSPRAGGKRKDNPLSAPEGGENLIISYTIESATLKSRLGPIAAPP